MNLNFFRLVASVLVIGLTGCSVIPAAGAGPGLVQSKAERITLEDVPTADTAALVEGNTAFALTLYHALQGAQGNLFYSPYSISQALAMTYGGAQGKTHQQMADVLHYTLPDNRLHATVNALDVALVAEGGADNSDASFKLAVVNALWGQTGYSFQPDFLDLLAKYYGAGMHTLDFMKNPEPSRLAINQWVSQQTNQRIQDLLGQGAITPATRMVLTNAIYFKAAWQKPFDKNQTSSAPFYPLDGSTVQAPMMNRMTMTGYVQENGVQAAELAYRNDQFSMYILMPDPGTFSQFEQSLDAPRLEGLIKDIKPLELDLTLPKFTFSSDFSLGKVLAGMGMADAFIPGVADFSGMDGGKGQLFLQDVVHKAYVAVDEQGTEAAAATGVVVGSAAMPAQTAKLVVDHPFLFLIRNRQSGEILFLGRVINPA